MIIMTTGGRNHDDRDAVRRALEPYAQVGTYLVVGGAPGWDELARQYWHNEVQNPYIVHPAPWNRVGRAAGPMRNMAMVRGQSLAPHAILVPDLVVAGPGGKGTAHAVRFAADQGLEVVL